MATITYQISQKHDMIWSYVTESLLVVSTDMSVTVIPRVPPRLLLLAQYLRISDEKHSVALVSLTRHRLPPEPLQIVDEALVEENNNENTVEVQSLDMAKSKKDQTRFNFRIS